MAKKEQQLSNEEQKAKLLAELDKIAELATNQFDFLNRSNEYLYKALAETYMWWQEAKKIDGFLEEQYAKQGYRKKSKQEEENFRYLLRLVWQMDMDSSSSRALLQQWSYALRELHKEYTENPVKYSQNPVQRLFQFIESNNGIYRLIGADKYAKSFNEAEEEEEAKKSKGKRTPEDEEKIRKRHLELARSFYPTYAGFLTIKTGQPIATDDKGYALALVRHTEHEGVFDVLATVEDDRIVEDALISSYRHHRAVSPPVVQLLIEVIQTQCLSQKLEPLRDSFVEATKHIGKDGKPFRQNKRMIFRKSVENILFSENRTSCSVVTIAKPYKWVVRSSTDVYLNGTDRRYLEQFLIQRGDTNLYTANATDSIPELRDANYKASHRLQLTHQAIDKKRPIYFYSAALPEHPPPNADIKPECQHPTQFTATVDDIWFERFNVMVILPYLQETLDHLKRPKHKLLKINLSSTGISFNYNGENGNLSNLSREIPFGKAAKGKASLHILTKDFIPVMQGIAKMNIVDKVRLAAGEDVLSIAFKTDLAEYSIYIPTATVKARRKSDSFYEYHMFGARQ